MAWQLRKYDLERLDPEWVVLLIGKNNCARPTQEAWRIDEGLMPDRLHLSPAGYELWAALLEQRLRRD